MLKEEILSLNKLLKNFTDQEIRLFRPPYGEIDEESYRTILEFGLLPVLWDLDTLDWDFTCTEPIDERVSRKLKQQNIILMHDGGGPREKTVQALPRIIDLLKQQGYEFLTIPEYFRRVYQKDV